MNDSKRIFDILLGVLVCFLLIGPALIVALLVWVSSDGPIIFWSDRVGRNNNIFSMAKFRTMCLDTPNVATNDLQNPESHLTQFGAFLRKTSLDELPQLWNILKGDMSFVGPRPALYSEADLIKKRNIKGVQVLIPGLTGWAQINGRDKISNAEKVAFDTQYLELKSIFFDIKILWLTMVKVIRLTDVSH
jgi:O-antigen biosynthesis protein WbqP